MLIASSNKSMGGVPWISGFSISPRPQAKPVLLIKQFRNM
jgi:hypothetical protein